MKTLSLLATIALALTVAGHALAAGCCPPAGGATPAVGADTTGAASPDGSLPPAENLLTLTGTVLSIAPNGAALVDTGTVKVFVVAPSKPTEDGTPPASPFKVGDRVQVAGVLLALSIQPAQDAGSQTEAQIIQARFRVDNILCGACATSVQNALQAAPGVKQASVTTEGTATVGYDPAVTNPEKLAQVIAHAKHPHGLKFKGTLLH